VEEPEGPVARECVEGYLFARPPLRLLIFRRPPSRGRFWVPISGKVEPTDRDFEAAVRRELAEETGLTRPTAVRDLDWQVRFRAENGEVWRLHAFAVEVPLSFEPRLSDEHEAAEWVAPAEAKRRLHFEDNRAAVDRLLGVLGSSPAPNA
jgi:8-oxo-dGTP pyrophosphatase MutT (NUDIX family)